MHEASTEGKDKSMQQNEALMTPQQHAQHIASLLQQAEQECRTDIHRVNDVKAQALFETLAEVLDGAIRALDHYQHSSEEVWRGPSEAEQQAADAETPEKILLPTHQRPPLTGPQPPVVTEMAPDIDEKEPPKKLFTE